MGFLTVIGAVLAAVIAVPLLIAFALAFNLIFAWPLMWAWNYVIPEMFKLPTLDYWHAFAMLVVATLLVKSSSSSNSK